jgi:hypothetical protein
LSYNAQRGTMQSEVTIYSWLSAVRPNTHQRVPLLFHLLFVILR